MYTSHVKGSTTESPLICVDFGSQTHLPKTPDGEAYYLHQLTIQHLGLHRFPSDHVTIHSYPETCGGKGTNDVCTAVYETSIDLASKGAKSLTIASDGTMAQNRSQYSMCVPPNLCRFFSVDPCWFVVRKKY